jgi:hypothetical protein
MTKPDLEVLIEVAESYLEFNGDDGVLDSSDDKRIQAAVTRAKCWINQTDD